jgi:hypothetical protein
MNKSSLTKAIEMAKAEHAKGGAGEHIMNLFKAVLSTTPIGGLIASLMSDYIPSSKQLRMETFVNEAAEALETLQDQIDVNRIHTDHYAYIFEQCLRGAAQYPQQEKLDCYKAILINAAKPSDNTDDQQDYFLNLVNTLAPVHIRLLGALYAAMKIPQNGPETGRTIRSMMGSVDGDIIMSAAAELYQLQFTNTQPSSMPITADLSRAGGRLTPIARKFVEFCTL